MTDTLYLLNKVKNPSIQWGGNKAIKQYTGKGGFKGTAIAPATLICMATELWGPMGLAYGKDGLVVPGTWGFEVYRDDILAHEHVTNVKFWYPRILDGITYSVYTIGYGCTPITEQVKGEDKPTSDIAKKSFTDACGNAMYRAGFGIEIYLGMYDDLSYVKDVEERQKAERSPYVVDALITLNRLAQLEVITPEDKTKWDSVRETIRGFSESEKAAVRGAAMEVKRIMENP